MNAKPPDGEPHVAQLSEALAKALFDNISHELKTPFTVILATLEQPIIDRGEIAQAAKRLENATTSYCSPTRNKRRGDVNDTWMSVAGGG